MFKLKNSQGPVRFLFQQALHHHYHRQYHLLMAHMVGFDPSSHFSKAFSQYSSLSSDRCGSSACYLSFPFLRKQLYANVFRINRRTGFSLQGCFDTNGNGNELFLKPKARGFASFPRPPLLADLDDVTDRDDAINRSLNGSPTNPLSFQDHRMSEKLVVAVDVDEGIYAYASLYLTSYILGYAFHLIFVNSLFRFVTTFQFHYLPLTCAVLYSVYIQLN